MNEREIPTTQYVYACTICDTAYHHPLIYCPRCPGKLVRRDLPWDGEKNPKGWFEGKGAAEKYAEWLKQNGLRPWDGTGAKKP